jgi:hypothetical protein
MVPAFCIMLGAIEVSAYTSLLPGDFNEDGIVNFDDVFNQPVADENRKYDLAQDGISTDFSNFCVFPDNFNETLASLNVVLAKTSLSDEVSADDSLAYESSYSNIGVGAALDLELEDVLHKL